MTKSLGDWLDWIKNYHDQDINYSLDNISQVAAGLDLCKFSIPVITVAGTNGKGTCIATMQAVLIAHGYKVAAYTSPHMFKFTERITINAMPIAEDVLCKAMQVIHDYIAQHNFLPLSYFEFATAAALWIFKQAELDFLLLEVGLGGRLDAVNVVQNSVAVIASISLDHCAYLGNTREAIGLEKAGIIKQQGLVVYGEDNIPFSVLRQVQQQEAQLFCVGLDYNYQQFNASWSWCSGNRAYHNLPIPNFPLQNAATALQTLHLLPNLDLQENIIQNALRDLQVVGRLQIEQHNNKRFIFDVAHNPAAVSWLSTKLTTLGNSGNTVVILAIVASKDSHEMLKTWHYPVSKWFVCAPSRMRRATSVELLTGAISQTQGGEIVPCASVEQALNLADDVTDVWDQIIIFGSFHTVALALDEFKRMSEQ